MAFADLKNDFVFRRIFATHPDTFTQEELDAYQRVIDEIQQVKELVEAKLAEGHKAGLAEGEARGKIAALLAVLTARGLSVTEEARARIGACEDAATLDRWIARAATASSLEEVFTSPEASS